MDRMERATLKASLPFPLGCGLFKSVGISVELSVGPSTLQATWWTKCFCRRRLEVCHRHTWRPRLEILDSSKITLPSERCRFVGWIPVCSHSCYAQSSVVQSFFAFVYTKENLFLSGAHCRRAPVSLPEQSGYSACKYSNFCWM